MTRIPGHYVSVHIYYNADDLRPVLLDCVAPLVEELSRASLISRFFFIRYWEGGAHVRLRLLLANDRDTSLVTEKAGAAVTKFLHEQPSLLDPDPTILGPVMRRLYIMEYGEQSYVNRFGESGIPLRKNNSFSFETYAQELNRYGGVEGMDLAERHFWNSSECVLSVLAEHNRRLRPYILGAAFQFMLHFAHAFLGDMRDLSAFFQRYNQIFSNLVASSDVELRFRPLYEQQKSRLMERISELEELTQVLLVTDVGPLARLVQLAPRLGEDVARLDRCGKLSFEQLSVTGRDVKYRLLANYLHMSNNRLGVRIAEEMYIAYMIAAALNGEPMISPV